MLRDSDIPIFIDEDFIDELWVRVTRSGLKIEEVKEASAKVKARAKFSGLGKLWDFFLPEVEAELAGEIAEARSSKTQITSILRALLLPDLLSSVSEISHSDSDSTLSALDTGSFVKIQCSNLALTPIPSLAAYQRQVSIESLLDGDVKSSEFLELLGRATDNNRALAFHSRTSDNSAETKALRTLFESESSEIYNILSLSNDDLFLAAATIKYGNFERIVFTVMEEQHLKRNLGAFVGHRPIYIFGQAAYYRVETEEIIDPNDKTGQTTIGFFVVTEKGAHKKRRKITVGTEYIGVRTAVLSLC